MQLFLGVMTKDIRELFTDRQTSKRQERVVVTLMEMVKGRIVETTDILLKTTLSTLAANNAVNEILYMGKNYSNKEVDILNYKITVNQDFEDLMGFRVLKVEAGTPENGKLVEIYEVR